MSTGGRFRAGPVWLVGAAICFALMGITVKQAVTAGGVNIFQLGLIRFLTAAIGVTLPALFGCWSLRVINRSCFLLRGFFGAAARGGCAVPFRDGFCDAAGCFSDFSASLRGAFGG